MDLAVDDGVFDELGRIEFLAQVAGWFGLPFEVVDESPAGETVAQLIRRCVRLSLVGEQLLEVTTNRGG